MSDILFRTRESVATGSPAPTQARRHRPLRILIPSYRSAPFSGGQGIYVRYLSKALADRGHLVDVASGPPYPELDPGIRLIKLPSLDLHSAPNGLTAFRLSYLRSWTNTYEWLAHNSGKFPEPYTFGRRLVKFLRTSGAPYDIVHDNQSLGPGLLDIQKMGMPVTATIHHPITKDLAFALDAEKRAAIRWLMKRWHSFIDMQAKVAQRIATLIVVSENTKQDLISDFGLSQNQMQVIHNGVDTDVFRPLPHIPKQDNRIITTASADVALKGLSYLLSAFADLRQTHPNARLVIIGRPNNGRTRTQIDRLGLESAITFKSKLPTEQLVEEYAKASVAVCPSLYEGFGFPAAEAMACGVPLISTNGGALPEVVGDAGCVVPAGDAAELTRALSDLLDNKDRRDALADKGRQRMLTHFTWAQAAHAYEEVYNKIISHAHG